MADSLNVMWTNTVAEVLANGDIIAPRGIRTSEILHHAVAVDMRMPILTVPARKLSYRFMAAEAYWICSGSDLVGDIVPYNQNMLAYSDDGVRFYGAYGPRVRDQMTYVVNKLLKDPDTRQGVISIWRPNPPNTKDTPCTLAMDFKIRNGFLNAHVYMRSSDVWLGLPYDVFSFSMVAYAVCTQYNFRRTSWPPILPGTLYLTASSCHLYEQNWEAARLCLEQDAMAPMIPLSWFDTKTTFAALMKNLVDMRDNKASRWWQ